MAIYSVSALRSLPMHILSVVSELSIRLIQLLGLSLVVLHKLPDHQIKHHIFGSTTKLLLASIHRFVSWAP